jgi:serine protease Do
MEKNTKKTMAIVGLVIIIFIVLAISSYPSQASASFLGDVWSSITRPFANLRLGGVGTSTIASSSGSLYKPAFDYESAVVNATKQASPAVVSITISANVPVLQNCSINPFQNLPPEFQNFFGDGGDITQQCNTGKTQLQEVGGGSGFIVSSDGLILTNKHVVSQTGASYSVLTNDGKTYNATVLARDPGQDLAILKINATNLPTVVLGDSDGLQLGQTAIAIGNALGQFSNTVSVGVVSGLARTVTASAPDTGIAETIQGVIQTDAAINPGNSGGPLLNLNGEVIGIDTAVASDAQNIGFAIPINQAKHDISSVEATGQIKEPYLGVRYTPITPTVAQQEKLSVTQGALVKGDGNGNPAIEPNSPAAAAGIKSGDIIEKINGQVVDATHDLGTLINQYNVGDTISITILRAGKEIVVSAILAKRI